MLNKTSTAPHTSASTQPTAASRAPLLQRWTMSHTNYWLGFTLDALVSILVVVAGFAAVDGAFAIAALVVAITYPIYTLHEYVMHRWLYHGWHNTAQVMHGLHHSAPRKKFGAPFFFTLVQCATGWALASLVVGSALAAVFAGSMLLIHTCEGSLHHAMHQTRAKGHGWFARLRRAHLIHHRRDDVNFGVISTVWDRVFRTRAEP